MTTASVLLSLQAATLATSAAGACVLLARQRLRRLFGPGWAYGVWVVVPLAGLAAVLPHPFGARNGLPATLASLVPGESLTHIIQHVPGVSAAWLLGVWGAGCVLSLAWLVGQQWHFERALGARPLVAQPRRADAVRVPLVVGVFTPRIVLPDDFEMRYTHEQRAMILAHERLHIERGDPASNAIALLVRSVFWFNPLLHVAHPRFRLDQEMACDAEVFRLIPGASRRAYAKAILQSHAVEPAASASLAWNSGYQIKERVMSLKHVLPRMPLSRAVGSLLLSVTGVGVAFVAWSASEPLVQTMTVQWSRPASGHLSVSLTSRFSTRTADGGVDLAGDVVFKVTADSLRVVADDLKSIDSGNQGHVLEANGHVEIQFGPRTVTTTHALIVENAGTSTITMQEGHLANPGY